MEAYAVEHADGVLRRVQGSQNPEDRPRPNTRRRTPVAVVHAVRQLQQHGAQPTRQGAQGQEAQVALWAVLSRRSSRAPCAFLSGKTDKDDDDKYLDDLAAPHGRGPAQRGRACPRCRPLVLSLAESEGSPPRCDAGWDDVAERGPGHVYGATWRLVRT